MGHPPLKTPVNGALARVRWSAEQGGRLEQRLV
jgi:hypothetical protein